MRGNPPKPLTRERITGNVYIDGAGCWLWKGGTQGRYGYVHHEKQRTLTHRAAYLLFVGAIPDGHVVMHACDVCLCCNPAHLRTGTQADNLRDMTGKGRRRHGTTRGASVGNSILNDDMVRTIRARVSSGERHRDVAASLGIGKSTVTGVATRRAWSHVQ